jgi:hypothetical protein
MIMLAGMESQPLYCTTICTVGVGRLFAAPCSIILYARSSDISPLLQLLFGFNLLFGSMFLTGEYLITSGYLCISRPYT